jgi:hypothetical protein
MIHPFELECLRHTCIFETSNRSDCDDKNRSPGQFLKPKEALCIVIDSDKARNRLGKHSLNFRSGNLGHYFHIMYV